MNKPSAMLMILLIVLSFSSCNGVREKNYTPKEFLNHTTVNKEDYTKDSVEVMQRLRNLLLQHEEFFYNKAYFDSTQLIIDSIIYSPDFNRLAVFVIVKNPTYRQLVPDKNHKWYYDATCYLGIRQCDTISLSWVGPNFSNSIDEKKLSTIIRDSYFTEFATSDTSDKALYKYNLNDVRFWDGPIWEKIENEKKRKKELEDEKKNHPENVYDNKKTKPH